MPNEIFLENGEPAVGFGTWRLGSGAEVTEAVAKALALGYRHFDCAYSYGNDFFVGKAIKKAEVDRAELKITNKLWRSFTEKEEILNVCKKSLKLMKLEYFDRYLIHWPVPTTVDGWREKNGSLWEAMQELRAEGLVREIGVSNFLPHHLQALLEQFPEAPPAVDQIEYHPGYLQQETVEFCKAHGIALEAWSPLGSGKLLQDPELVEAAQRKGCSTAQLVLLWELQNGVTPICRSSNEARMRENLFLPELVLSAEEMALIAKTCDGVSSGFHPDLNPAE